MTDEYIKKQDAFDAVEARIAELMTHPEFRRKHLDIDLSGVIRNISAIKPADVAPVVRCKDCKSRRIDGYCTKFQNNISGIAVSWFMPEDDGFCSYGERKGE